MFVTRDQLWTHCCCVFSRRYCFKNCMKACCQYKQEFYLINVPAPPLKLCKRGRNHVPISSGKEVIFSCCFLKIFPRKPEKGAVFCCVNQITKIRAIFFFFFFWDGGKGGGEGRRRPGGGWVQENWILGSISRTVHLQVVCLQSSDVYGQQVNSC